MSEAMKNELSVSLKMPRPPCPVCEWPLWLWQIAPGEDKDTEEQMFICPRCDHEEVRVHRAHPRAEQLPMVPT